MRKRINIIAVAFVLAILSFAYARYDYINKHSVKVGTTTIGMTGDLFGDWVKEKDAVVFALVIPAALILVGLGLAVGKK
jgi:uncharacterized membrane protein